MEWARILAYITGTVDHAAGRATYAKTDALLTTMTAGELASQLP
jgi:hypothetical protein